MSLSDAGKFAWRNGASIYIFSKDASRVLELSVKPLETKSRAADGTLRGYASATIKKHVELEFSDIGATQVRQFATIWKANTIIGFWRRQDEAQVGTFWWTGDSFDFSYSDAGIYYKNLYSGRITLEEI